MKKTLAFVLALALLLACSSAFAVEKLEGLYTGDHIAEGQYPIEGNVTLSYWMPINKSAVAFISNYDENPAYTRRWVTPLPSAWPSKRSSFWSACCSPALCRPCSPMTRRSSRWLACT